MAVAESNDGDLAAREESGYVAFGETYDSFSAEADAPPRVDSESDEVVVDYVNGSEELGFGQSRGAFGESGTVPISNGDGNSPFNVGLETEGIFSGDGPILPPPSEMVEEGLALREWRRLNAIRLEEKEKREKEVRNQIIEEAEEFKLAFVEKVNLHMETNKSSIRDKEKMYLASQEKFHEDADKHYWKAIAELIPNEVPNIEKKGKKDKKPSITIIQGPKPGRATELSRLRSILVKLKHNAPPHILRTNANAPVPAPAAEADDDGATAPAPNGIASANHN